MSAEPPAAASARPLAAHRVWTPTGEWLTLRPATGAPTERRGQWLAAASDSVVDLSDWR